MSAAGYEASLMLLMLTTCRMNPEWRSSTSNKRFTFNESQWCQKEKKSTLLGTDEKSSEEVIPLFAQLLDSSSTLLSRSINGNDQPSSTRVHTVTLKPHETRLWTTSPL
jgi:hypothetical protein